ncbi:reverse transcriptase domain-containing protein [Tanacetum coccineum]
MWGTNRAVAPTFGAVIAPVDLCDNFTMKGCNNCGVPHPSSECDDKPMGGPEDEVNYVHGGYLVGGYRENYYSKNSRNCHDRQPRDENRHLQLHDDKQTTDKKHKESDFEKTMREFMVIQKSSNDFVKNQFFNLKAKVELGKKNHQAVIQDLETEVDRLYNQSFNRPPGTLPRDTRPNPKQPSGSNDKPYHPPPARNEHVNVVFTRSVADNMLVQVGQFIFQIDFIILKMEEYNRVPLILGRPFLHTTNAIIRVKGKELNLKVGDERITFLIDKAMQNSHSNDDTCFSIDINETDLDKEFIEFMEVKFEEFPKEGEDANDSFEELTLEEQLRIKKSIQDPLIDLEMKPLPAHLEYAYQEK